MEYCGIFSGKAISLEGEKAFVVDGNDTCMTLDLNRTTVHPSVKVGAAVKVETSKKLFCRPRYNVLPA